MSPQGAEPGILRGEVEERVGESVNSREVVGQIRRVLGEVPSFEGMEVLEDRAVDLLFALPEQI
ncbi:hypothetical protein [Actinocorallia herbida]|uniref:hypothetical protein n=1 Tax=Actinocorallia herbida TaxID=58109 RepID=UPI000F4D1F1E|nr:hypothetical protein [Actinocorallia herbida]